MARGGLTLQGFAWVTGDSMEKATHGECGPPLYEDDTLRQLNMAS